ncbi:hypothetical protein [Foliimonas ilicis]
MKNSRRFDGGCGSFFGFEGFVERGLADFHTRGGFANIEAGSQMLAGLSELLRRDDSLPASAPTAFLCCL